MFNYKEDGVNKIEADKYINEISNTADIPITCIKKWMDDLRANNVIPTLEEMSECKFSGSKEEVESMDELNFFNFCNEQFFLEPPEDFFDSIFHTVKLLSKLTKHANYADKLVEADVIPSFFTYRQLYPQEIMNFFVEIVGNVCFFSSNSFLAEFFNTRVFVQLLYVANDNKNYIPVIVLILSKLFERINKMKFVYPRQHQLHKIIKLVHSVFVEDVYDTTVNTNCIKMMTHAFDIFRPDKDDDEEDLNDDIIFTGVDDEVFKIFMDLVIAIIDTENKNYAYKLLSCCFKFKLQKEVAEVIGESFYNDALLDNIGEINCLDEEDNKIAFIFSFSAFFQEKEIFFHLLDKIAENFQALHISVKKNIINYLLVIRNDRNDVFLHIIENGLLNMIFSLLEGGETDTCKAVCFLLYYIIDSAQKDIIDALAELATEEEWIDKMIETIDDCRESSQFLEETLESLKKLVGYEDEED